MRKINREGGEKERERDSLEVHRGHQRAAMPIEGPVIMGKGEEKRKKIERGGGEGIRGKREREPLEANRGRWRAGGG